MAMASSHETIVVIVVSATSRQNRKLKTRSESGAAVGAATGSCRSIVVRGAPGETAVSRPATTTADAAAAAAAAAAGIDDR